MLLKNMFSFFHIYLFNTSSTTFSKSWELDIGWLLNNTFPFFDGLFVGVIFYKFSMVENFSFPKIEWIRWVVHIDTISGIISIVFDDKQLNSLVFVAFMS